jgi:hypothetical protein
LTNGLRSLRDESDDEAARRRTGRDGWLPRAGDGGSDRDERADLEGEVEGEGEGGGGERERVMNLSRWEIEFMLARQVRGTRLGW